MENWENKIIENLEERGLTTSDAQGILDANSFKLMQMWAKGIDAESAAKELF